MAVPLTTTATLTGPGTWDLVTIPKCECYSFQLRSGADVKISSNSNGSDYFTLPSGVAFDSPLGIRQSTAIYVSGPAAAVLEIIRLI